MTSRIDGTMSSEDVVLEYDRGTIVVRKLEREIPPLRWDPRTKCLRALAYKYLEVRRSLESLGLNVKDIVLSPLKGSIGSPNLKPLRSYQEEAVEAWLKAGRRGIVVLPTGTGKTLIAIKIIALLNEPTLVVVPTIELLNQWKLELSKALNTHVGVLGGGSRELAFITVSTYNSAYINAEDLGNKFMLLVFDEVHHLPSENFRQIALLSAAPYRLGLTATFEREDGKHVDLPDLVGDVVYRKAVYEMKSKHLADFDLIRVYVELTDEEEEKFMKLFSLYKDYLMKRGWRLKSLRDFKRLIMASGLSSDARRALLAWRDARLLALNSVSKLDVLKDLLKRHQQDKIIIFTELNRTVRKISRELLIPEITYKTKPKERALIMELFKKGIYKAVVTSRVLEEGIDVPDASVAIILSGTGSRRSFIQRLGRILRPAPNKRAVLYEIVTKGTPEVVISRRRRKGLVSG
ncbi:MAG: DEAD/DEAH box helicase family protein [Candidatus Nezhaarchaeota archaeon]|nr:DEAD/DEAH box helicase family protein [Candidatus Nezhaarchaeota archaeon]MCX8142355.1 DEAD/DEAH box helicase family protein [Candidatus Nezhaarchaeota archaeon]MDW8050672.1 DEAD/DEAH box helicase family protein [Nitrososphaerota archaeon]